MAEPRFKAGHEFVDPDTGQGYRLNRDVFSADMVEANLLEPFNGAPLPLPCTVMPGWLQSQIWPDGLP